MAKAIRTPPELKLELVRLETGKEKFLAGCDTIKAICKTTGLLGCVAFVSWVLVESVHQSMEQIQALTGFVRDWRISEIVLAIGNALMFGLWRRERRGKKRAIKLKGEYQRRIEASDPDRRSSGLTPTGDSPREEEDD